MTIKAEIARSIIDMLSIRANAVSVKHLAEMLDLDIGEVEATISYLVDVGAVEKKGDMLIAFPWWDLNHVELNLDIPKVSINLFQEYAQSIDEFVIGLREEGFDVLRPYTHETSIQVILSAAAGFALAEFFKPFFGELGKRFAIFLESSLQRFRSKGISEIQVNTTRRSADGSYMGIQITISNGKQIDNLLKKIESDVESRFDQLSIGDEVKLSGHGWHVTVRKGQKEDDKIPSL
jgi:putative lipoic acid-binding regulatory protein